MKKPFVALLVSTSVILIMMLTGCQCNHEEATEATCTEPSVCVKCDAQLAEPAGHNYVGATTIFPTCTTEGVQTFTCAECGDSYDETIHTLDHEGPEVTLTQATLSEKGTSEIHCTMCGEVVLADIPTIGSSPANPYVVSAAALYNDCMNDRYEQYLSKFLRVTGTVTTISDQGNLKGYYLHGTIGNGMVCWVNNSELVVNTGSYAEFDGYFAQSGLGVDNVEMSSCTLASEAVVLDEPGLSQENPIPIILDEISARYQSRWIQFAGRISSIVPYGEGAWYYLDGDVACYSTEVWSIGDMVTWVGRLVGVGDNWATVADCFSIVG